MGQSSGSEREKERKKRSSKNTLQLEVLKTAFEKTPKPTRNAREQLAKDTGLSLREIQVSLSPKILQKKIQINTKKIWICPGETRFAMISSIYFGP